MSIKELASKCSVGVLAVSVAALMGASLSPTIAAPSVRWRCTTDAERWVDKGALAPSTATNAATCIVIDPSTLYQKIEGWGGCFNELGWDSLSAASETDRQDAIKALFRCFGKPFSRNRRTHSIL